MLIHKFRWNQTVTNLTCKLPDSGLRNLSGEMLYISSSAAFPVKNNF